MQTSDALLMLWPLENVLFATKNTANGVKIAIDGRQAALAGVGPANRLCPGPACLPVAFNPVMPKLATILLPFR